MHDSLLDPEPEPDYPTLDEWVAGEQPDKAHLLFEEWLFGNTNPVTEIACADIVMRAKWGTVGCPEQKTYSDMFDLWWEKYIDESALRQIEDVYASWCAEQ